MLDVPKVVMVLDKDIDKVTILGHVDHFGLISFKNRHLFANRGSVILLVEKNPTPLGCPKCIVYAIIKKQQNTPTTNCCPNLGASALEVGPSHSSCLQSHAYRYIDNCFFLKHQTQKLYLPKNLIIDIHYQPVICSEGQSRSPTQHPSIEFETTYIPNSPFFPNSSLSSTSS